MSPALADLAELLPELMLRDEHRLARRLERTRGIRDPRRRQAATDQIAADAQTARQRVARRRAAVPALRYPPELPVSRRREEIAAAIRDHQVVVLAGETGSGKTTQLPKICLGLGHGVRGLVGHTQPRRIAARTVAERVASELDTPVGGAVGWKVRFTDEVGEDTLVKLMTDGILLAELASDPELRQYDTLILDEAHERSLTIDFLLGYLKDLLPRRPDLKLVITSATIDPRRFADHFGGAPVIEVSGRTYPVEVRYRPYGEEPDDDRDQTQAICDAVAELTAEGPGDVLVFLSGEREISDTADAVAAMKLRDTEVLPLYARLSAAEQHRVFTPHTGRRIVLATNIAETSLTVPGVRYVVDPGTARISRYSRRLKVQRLPIEAVSRASANQRAGRCGRTSDGVCIRLYSEAELAGRPEFTDPEILRTNLAAVILQMAALGLGEVADFPFLDPPDRRAVADGVVLLHELGAFDPSETDTRKRLTPLGRRLVQLPVDPRLGRMVLAAGDNGCVDEVLVIAAALSIQDPRERPVEHREAADAAHARFARAPGRQSGSDFLAWLSLWRYLAQQQKTSSSSRFRKLCRAEYLNYLRVREWQDLYGQLRAAARGVGIRVSPGRAEPDLIHRSLLAGLLSHVGRLDAERRDYLGARGVRFAAFPGSALSARPPRWVMAAELVETSRLWGRTLARVEPAWVEELAGHLVTRSYREPHWERGQGAVMAFEKVSLYGVPVVAGRTVTYSHVDPGLCRELFIRHALVEGDWDTHHEFFHRNRELLADAAELEHRARRRDIVVDDETLVEFYDSRIPADVTSARHFDAWWRDARRGQPDLLTFSPALLVTAAASQVDGRDYPDGAQSGGLTLPLSYHFEPGSAADGVTASVPLAALHQVRGADLSWQVPGLREDLVTALLRSLPKPLRRALAPVADTARAVMAGIDPIDTEAPLLDALARELHTRAGVDVPRSAWRLDTLPPHLRMTFRVVDEADRPLAEGKDLDELKRELAPQVTQALSAAGADLERSGLRDWEVGTLPRSVTRQHDGYAVTAYPALVDEGVTVGVRLFADAAQADRATWQGTRRLLRLAVPSPVRSATRSLDTHTRLLLARNPHGSLADLLDDAVAAAVDRIMTQAGGPARDEAGFAELRERVKANLGAVLLDVLADAARVLAAWHDAQARLAASAGRSLAPALADIRAQLAALVYPGFLTATGADRLPDLTRYLRAVDRRLEKLPSRPDRDRDQMTRVEAVSAAYRELLDAQPPGEPPGPELTRIRWMIEELRVSYFAQTLGTAYPVSDKRIYRAMDELRD